MRTWIANGEGGGYWHESPPTEWIFPEVLNGHVEDFDESNFIIPKDLNFNDQATSRYGDYAEYDCDICGGTIVWCEPDGGLFDRAKVRDCRCGD